MKLEWSKGVAEDLVRLATDFESNINEHDSHDARCVRAALAQITALEAALGPFAAFAKAVEEIKPAWDRDDYTLDVIYTGGRDVRVSLADCRAARSAMEASESARRAGGGA